MHNLPRNKRDYMFWNENTKNTSKRRVKSDNLFRHLVREDELFGGSGEAFQNKLAAACTLPCQPRLCYSCLKYK